MNLAYTGLFFAQTLQQDDDLLKSFYSDFVSLALNEIRILF